MPTELHQRLLRFLLRRQVDSRVRAQAPVLALTLVRERYFLTLNLHILFLSLHCVKWHL